MADRIVTAPNWWTNKWQWIPRLPLRYVVCESMLEDPDNPPAELFDLVRRQRVVRSYGIDRPPPRAPNWSEAQIQRRKEFIDRAAILSSTLYVKGDADAFDLPKSAEVLARTGRGELAELLGMAPEKVLERKPDTTPHVNIFKSMDGLKWSEVVVTFIEPEAVRIKARGRSETFTYEAIGFKHKLSRTAKPNSSWNTLLTLAIADSTDTVSPRIDFKRRVSRLRKALQAFFGIDGDPLPYIHGTYQSAFVLAADEHVIRHVRDRRVVPDDEDEEDIEALMSSPPGR